MITKRNLLAAALGGAITPAIQAQTSSDSGAVAAQVAGRMHLALDGSLQTCFYFLFVDGVGSDLFSGTPSERTAHFTMRTDLLRPLVTMNGDAAHLGFQPLEGSEGLYRLYYNATPSNRQFTRPETFAQGQEIATFRSRRTQATLLPGSQFVATGTADLVSSSEANFRGQAFDIGKVYRKLSFEFHIKPLVLAELGVATISLPLGGHMIKVP